MKKKYYSLIYGDALHEAPESKILSSEAYSKLIEGEELIEKIHEETKQYREEVAKECEVLKAEAEAEGFDKGMQEWAEKIATLETEIQKVRSDLEEVITTIALKAAKKIVGREMETSREVIVDIVRDTLKSVAQYKHIVIYVNKEDHAVLEQQKNGLKTLFEKLETLSVRPSDDVAPGGCLVETEGGIINARLKHRWETLEKAFSSLLK